jgi:uncharacterized protein YebE (UPF0316 family)
MSVDVISTALIIFALRVFNNALSTIRVVLITRDRRLMAAALAFIEALVFAVVVSTVVRDLANIPNLLAYCAGFAVGGYVGMVIEARYVTSYVVANVVTHTRGHEIAVLLRERGYGVTESQGEGREGNVDMIRSVIQRRDVPNFMKIVRELQPDAFVSISEVRAIQHGWIRQSRQGLSQE